MLMHALEARALSRRHVASFPCNYRHLRCRHGDERWGGGRPLDSNPGCTELYDVLPDIALFPLTVPLQFLETRRELKDFRHPFIYPILMSPVKLAILTNKLDFPFRELLLFGTRVRRK